MDMDRASVLAIHERITVRMKQRAVKHNSGMADLNPMLFLTYEDGTHYVGKPIAEQMGPDFDLSRALALDVFTHWAMKRRKIERLVILMDAYVQMREGASPEEAINDIRRGDLGKDFRENPASDVGEGMVTCAAWYGDDDEVHAWCVTHGYVISDGGVLVWKEPHSGDEMIITEEVSGMYGQVLSAASAVIHVTRDAEEEH